MLKMISIQVNSSMQRTIQVQNLLWLKLNSVWNSWSAWEQGLSPICMYAHDCVSLVMHDNHHVCQYNDVEHSPVAVAIRQHCRSNGMFLSASVLFLSLRHTRKANC